MKQLDARSLLVFALIGTLAGCGSEFDGDSSGIDSAAESLTTVATVDFESYPTGPLGSPWSVSQSPARASTIEVATSADHGKVLALHGSSALGEFLIASFPFSSSESLLHAQVDVKPSAGATFIFDVKGAGSSISARRVRLMRSPGSDALVAGSSGTPDLTCGNLPSGAWSTVTVDIRTGQSPHTFTVLINGQATACTNATTNMGAPFNGINIMDPSNEGWGGTVQFDKLSLSSGSDVPPCTNGTPATTVVSTNFNTTPLGALGSPWSVSPSSGPSTARIIDTSSSHGRALRLHGSTSNGNTVTAQLPFSATSPAIVVDFTARAASGSSFVFALNGAGSSIGARRIRLQRAPGSNTLVANTAGAGDVACGTLPSGVWSTVELAVHTQLSPHTFDVRINGAPTACTGTTTEMSAPFTSLSLMDASNAGWGGDVDFDDFVAKGSTESTCGGSP